MGKKELRTQMIQALASISDERKEEASSLACCFLLDLFLKEPGTKVLSFASKDSEINLWPLNQWLAGEQRLLLPKVEGDLLHIYEVEGLAQLKVVSWGLQEPDPTLCKKASLEEVRVVLVPSICFDDNKHRIGYGHGFYDRFLATIPGTLKWGIGLKEQKLSTAIPSHPSDVVLDELFLF